MMKPANVAYPPICLGPLHQKLVSNVTEFSFSSVGDKKKKKKVRDCMSNTVEPPVSDHPKCQVEVVA